MATSRFSTLPVAGRSTRCSSSEIKALPGISPAAGSVAGGRRRYRPAGGAGVATHFHEALGISRNRAHQTRRRCHGRRGAIHAPSHTAPDQVRGRGRKLGSIREPFVPDRARAGAFSEWATSLAWSKKPPKPSTKKKPRGWNKKLRNASFDFNDFLAQFKMMQKLGPLENILGMLPGIGQSSRA